MSAALQAGLRLGSKTNPLVVCLTEYEGHRLLDIRKHYVDKDTKTLQPTRKGLSLGAKLLKEVQTTLNDNEKAIFAWLNQGGDDTLIRVTEAMEARAKARDHEASRARPFKLKQDSWSGPAFFSVETHGADDVLHLNKKHPVFALLENRSLSQEELQAMLSLILISFYRAKLRFPGQLEVDSDRLFDALEFEWGAILQNYCHAKDK